MSYPKTIILATDSPEEFSLPVSTLATKGSVTRHVKGTYNLVAKFAAKPAEAVILDLDNMQHKDLEVISVLRGMSPQVGIVAVAGLAQRELAASALSAGADIYLLKPVSRSELLEAVERADRRRQLTEVAHGGDMQAEAVTNFALGVAHEINNPLTTISGWLQMLIGDRADDKQLAELLKSMKEEADRIAEVVTQLLTFAQEGPPRNDQVNIGRVLRELERAHSMRLKSKDIGLVTHIDSGLPAVSGDARQLRRACDTILVESEATLNSKGRIEISCRKRDDGVEIVFLDDGLLIPKTKLAHIFEPFRHDRREDGRGIGLCLAYGIIRSHGGTIEARSEESSGTRFTVWLPPRR